MFVDACTTIDFPFISSNSSPPILLVSFLLVLVKITSWNFLTIIILLDSTCNHSQLIELFLAIANLTI